MRTQLQEVLLGAVLRYLLASIVIFYPRIVTGVSVSVRKEVKYVYSKVFLYSTNSLSAICIWIWGVCRRDRTGTTLPEI